MTYHILTINPGATSTKVALFRDDSYLAQAAIAHDFQQQPSLLDQLPRRLKIVRDFLAAHLTPATALDAVVGRGGLLPPLPAGTYAIGAAMLDDLRRAERGAHASNLGALIAHDIGQEFGAPSFIVDPVSVDELEPAARVSGLAGTDRVSMCHALNIRAVAHRYARDKGRRIDDLRLIVAHLGTGISMAAIRRGRLIDVVNPRDEGPFGLDRPGALPNQALVDLCFAPGADRAQIGRMLLGDGGVHSYLGTRDLREVLRRRDHGEAAAATLVEAMIYDTAKWIGALATVLEGRLDAIILTGGMAHATAFVEPLSARIAWIAPITVHPGEDELQALADGALRVLRGEEAAREFGRV